MIPNITDLVLKKIRHHAPIIASLAVLMLLTACGGGGAGIATTTINGSAGDGPVTGGAVSVTDANGVTVTTTPASPVTGSDTNFSFTVSSNTALPITITVTGGTDTVTGMTQDFPLQTGVMTLPSNGAVTGNANPLTTLAVASALAKGALTASSLNTAMIHVLNTQDFGLPAGLNPMTTKVDATNVAAVIKANEAVAELIRRTSASTGKTMANTITAIAEDITDGVLDGKVAAGSTATQATAKTAGVILTKQAEIAAAILAGQLKITDKTGATRVTPAQMKSKLNAAILITQPTTTGAAANVLQVKVTQAFIDQTINAVSMANLLTGGGNAALNNLKAVIRALSANTVPGTTQAADILTELNNAGAAITTASSNANAGINTTIIGVATTTANTAPIFTGTPAISGTVAVGNTLSLINTATSDADIGNTLTLSYQWNANGAVIATAIAATYVVQAVDAGKQITAVITANDGTGAANATTRFTTAAVTVVDTTAPTNQDTVLAASTTVTGSGSVTIASSGTASNNVWLAPAGTTVFVAGTTMTKATSGTATSIIAPATVGAYKLFVLDAVGNVSTASTAMVTVNTIFVTATGSPFAAGTSPWSITNADFNGDGNADMAVANIRSSNVSVLLGDGAGGFAAAVNFATGTMPRSVTTADFNGDGNADMAVANFASDNVSVLLGDGTGSFAAASVVATGSFSRPKSVTSADFNGDGNADMAVANSGSFPNILGNVSVFLGDGSGGFAAAVNFTAGTRPRSVMSADFNGDGKADMAVVNAGFFPSIPANVSILLGDGAGGFAATSVVVAGSAPYSVTSADFNGDGNADMAVVNNASKDVSVLLGDGFGGFAAAVNFRVGTDPISIVSADFNGDGKADMAVTNGAFHNVKVFLGDGAGGFATSVSFATGTNAFSVTSADFNGDGKADMAVANANSNDVSVFLNQTTGTPVTNTPPTFTSTPAIVQTAVTGGIHLTVSGVAATDVNGNIVSLSYQWQANGVNITGATAPAYTVQAVDAGKSITVIITANDGTGAANAAISVTTASVLVAIPNIAPVAVNDTAITAEDTAITTVNVLLNDTDANGDTLSVSSADTASVSGGAVSNNNNGTFTYTPVLNFNGTDTFTYTVSDGNGGTAVGTVAITVTPVNDAPVFTATPAISGTAAAGNVLSLINTGTSDIDGNTVSLSYQWRVNGANIATGATYTVAIADTGKAITAIITANDGTGAANATATFTAAAVTVVDITPPAITLLGTNPVTVAQGSVYSDAGATASDNVDGNITANIVTVNPVNTAILGTYTVTYNASDAAGNAATQITRTVNVTDQTAPTNQNTVLTASTTVAGGGTVTIVTSGTASNNVWLAPSGTTTFTTGTTMTKATSGTATSITAPATGGAYKLFVIDAVGNVSTASTATVTVDITPPVLSSFTSTTANGGYKAGNSINITATYNEAPAVGSTLTVSLNSGKTGLILNTIAGNTVTGTYTVGAGENSADLTVLAITSQHVLDAAGNALTATALPTTNIAAGSAIVVDTTAPAITLLGTNPVTVAQGSVYSDAGATASDNVDGNITANIVTVNLVNTAILGTYTVTYNVSDVASNAATQITRTVNVTDQTAPTNQNAVLTATTIVAGGGTVTIVSSGTATNNVWLAPSGTTTFTAGTTMTKAANGIATSIAAPATGGIYKLFVIDAVGNVSTASTAAVTVGNVSPVAVNDTAITAEDTAITTVNVLLNDTDANGDTLSVFSADTTSISGGTVTNNNNGTFIYTPALNFNGADTFTYTVSDGRGGTAVGTVTVTVTPVNDAPVFTGAPAISGTAAAGNVLSLISTGASDVDGNTVSLSYQWRVNSANIATSPTYTVSLADTGKIITVVITANDGTGAINATATFTTADLTVVDVTPPVLSSFTSTTADGSYKAGASINITATYNEALASTSTLTVSLNSGKTGLVLNTVSGSIITGIYIVGGGETGADLSISAITSQNVKDIANNALTATTLPATNIAAGSAIVVDTTAPTITGHNPASNAANVAVNAAIDITFSEPVSNVTASTFTVTAGGTAIAGTVNHNAGNIESFSPASSLASGTTYTVTATTAITDLAGNALASATSWSFTTTAIPVVAALYPTNGTNWNDYVKNDGATVYSATDTACTGAETGGYSACIHGGEKRGVSVPGKTTCTNLTASDALVAFDWTCDASTNPVRMVSRVLKSSKNLSDLVNFTTPGWLNNSVTVKNGATTLFTTASTAWWGNTVKAAVANASLDASGTTLAGTVYLIPSNLATAFTIGASKVAVVIKPGVTITGSVTTGETIINSSGQNFLWIEGAIDGTGDWFDVSWGSAVFSVMRNISATNTVARFDFSRNPRNAGVMLSSRNNSLSNINASNNGNTGIYFFHGGNNSLTNITASNNGTYGLFLLSSNSHNLFNITASKNGSAGINLNGSGLNIMSNIMVTNNSNGINVFNTSGHNVLTNITATNNGLGVNFDTSSYSNIALNITATNNRGGINLFGAMFNTLSNINASNNTTFGVRLFSASYNTLSNITVTDNGQHGVNALSTGTSFNFFSGLLIVGNNAIADCASPAGNTGLINITCTDTGTTGSSTYTGQLSDATLATGVTVATSFIGKVTTDDLKNTSDTTGTATFPANLASFDWTSFDNAYRGWGKDGTTNSTLFPDPSQRGRWRSGTGRIWDWSLKSTDTVVRNVLTAKLIGSAASSITHQWSGVATSQASCTAAITGSVWDSVNSCSTTYLRNASEIMDDGIGNENGLCESNETCLYTPNIGSYQGHGALIFAGTFTNGAAITGVTLMKYSINGR